MTGVSIFTASEISRGYENASAPRNHVCMLCLEENVAASPYIDLRRKWWSR
jgi:hypothetical protein